MPVLRAIAGVIWLVVEPIYELGRAFVEAGLYVLAGVLTGLVGLFEDLAGNIDFVTAALQRFTGEAETAKEVWEGLQEAGRFIFGGRGAGAGAGLAPTTAAGGTTVTRTSTTTISAPISVTSTDPVAAGQEVEAALQRHARKLKAASAGAER